MSWAEIQQSDDWKAFANSTVELIFKNLNSDTKREKTWLIIQTLMNMYPQLDVYTHANNIAIVFGQKKLESEMEMFVSSYFKKNVMSYLNYSWEKLLIK